MFIKKNSSALGGDICFLYTIPMKVILTLTKSPLGGMETFSSHLCKTFPDLKIIDYNQACHSLLAKVPFPPATMLQKGMVISRHFMRMQRNLKAEVVFTSGLYGWYLALRGVDIPIVNILHGVANVFATNSYKKTTFDYYRMKYIYSLAEKISAKKSVSVCNSHFTKELIKKHYGVESNVIYNAVDTRIFRPLPKDEAKELLGLPDRTTAIFVGPLTYSKGFDVIQKPGGIQGCVCRRGSGKRQGGTGTCAHPEPNEAEKAPERVSVRARALPAQARGEVRKGGVPPSESNDVWRS